MHTETRRGDIYRILAFEWELAGNVVAAVALAYCVPHTGKRALANNDDEVEALKSVAVAVHVIGDDGKGDAGVDIGR
jgi:hypothetical protein